jgi:hypothetical protein
MPELFTKDLRLGFKKSIKTRKPSQEVITRHPMDLDDFLSFCDDNFLPFYKTLACQEVRFCIYLQFLESCKPNIRLVFFQGSL